MKKKISIIAIFLFVLICFSGCFYDKNNFARIDDVINTDSGTQSAGVVFNRPLSSDCSYTEPVELSDNPTEGEIVSAYMNSVVTIFVNNNDGVQISFGSGFCVHAGGYIATNYHVVSNVVESTDYTLSVYLNQSEESYKAKVLWSHASLDVAIIQCENGNIPFLPLKDRSVYPEVDDEIDYLETVITIGTPIDFSLQNSCSKGYVSGKNRHSVSDSNIYEDLIQHTASISNGCSGGPLIDINGNVIGLNTLGSLSGNDIYYAVPVYPIIATINKIVLLNEKSTSEYFKTPKIGIECCDKTVAYYCDYDFTGENMYVLEISQGYVIDLLKGDIITKITTNEKIFEIVKRNDLIYALINSSAGDITAFTVIRNGESKTVSVKLS